MIADLLGQVLDFVAQTGGVAAAVTVAVLFVGVAFRFANRDKLVFDRVSIDDQDLAKKFSDLPLLAESEVRQLIDVHQVHSEAAGDPGLFRELAPDSAVQDVGLELVNEKARRYIELSLRVFGHLLRPPTVRAHIYRQGDGLTVRASILRRSAPPKELEPISVPGGAERLKDHIARELGYKVVLALSTSLAVSDWVALDHLTRAIRVWPRKETIAWSKEQFEAVQRELLSAQVLDPGSALINYNLGLLYYYRLEARWNEEARVLFDRATRTSNLRLQGLATIGLARSLCQDYHRFGKQSPEIIERARDAASKAVTLLEQVARRARGVDAWRAKVEHARALYCQAFAFHMTERPDDLEQGGRLLEQVIAVLEEAKSKIARAGAASGRGEDSLNPLLATANNNLGYVRMAQAGRFVGGAAASLYGEADRYFARALEYDPRYKYALANRGNVSRLVGDLERALEWYREAVEIDPQYVNGRNEMAWVLLEMGEFEQAWQEHERAMQSATSDSQRSEVKELFARALYTVGARRQDAAMQQAAMEQAQLALGFDQKGANSTLREWLAEIEAQRAAESRT